MKLIKPFIAATLLIILTSCNTKTPSNIPLVGFVDAFEDATISQARTGFTDALKQTLSGTYIYIIVILFVFLCCELVDDENYCK